MDGSVRLVNCSLDIQEATYKIRTSFEQRLDFMFFINVNTFAA